MMRGRLALVCPTRILQTRGVVGSSRWEVSTVDPESRLRQLVLKETDNELPSERDLRLRFEKDNQFHHEFWLSHNSRFEQEKKAYSDEYRLKHGIDAKERLPVEVVAAFYKQFLDSNRQSLGTYAKAWRLNNFVACMMDIRASITRTLSRPT
eukprot:m.112075 g.112075  ORF g.112075 m.112075 type:complete len:152 (-) comp28165_c0_seq1:241-696(-)